MPRMDTGSLKALLSAEKSDALASMSASKLSDERAKALDYYNGEIPDMPAAQGRSQAVSTDVADTVEGLMPTLMEIFTAGDEVVKFEPAGPEDEQAAEQETDYVNHVFMQQNPGFIVLYSMIKDALLSKVGIVKVWWKEEERDERQTFMDLDDTQFMMLAQSAADGEIEIINHTVKDMPGEVEGNESGEDDSRAEAY